MIKNLPKKNFNMISLISILLCFVLGTKLSCWGFSSHSTTTTTLSFAPSKIRPSLLPVGISGVRRHDSHYLKSTTTTTSKKVYRASSLLNVGTTEDAVAAVQNDNDEKLFEGFGKGIVRDYKMRLPLYKSDLIDGINIQCLAATMSLFFACLAPAIGFGALFGVATGNAIGSVEMITSTAVCGIIYALTSAQPMTIIGK
jgi:hypothetical protein